MTKLEQAQKLREEAADCDRRAQESFERCDTDGFLSQWAAGKMADRKRLEAEVVENGGKWEFPGLFRKSDGKRIRAKVINTRFGTCWAIVGEDDKFTGQFFPTGEKSRKQKAAGLFQKLEEVEAGVDFTGGGRGLSGACNVGVGVYRKDNGYPENAVSY